MSAAPNPNLWVIVLAAGEGRRLSALTKDSAGVSVPKQYCSFGRSRSMVHWALDRARALVPDERIVTVVAREHRAYWELDLRALPAENVIVQPRNRGTAAGILMPLVEILKRDPEATVVVLPSDHQVDDEEVLTRSIQKAIARVSERPDRLVLLGITPDGAGNGGGTQSLETEYGWILPAARRSPACHAVERFVEKPDTSTATELLLQGAVWNSFVFTSSARTLLLLYGQVLPELQEPFLRKLVVGPHPRALDELYEELPSRDFSRELLERVPERLELVVVPPCGWSDLGTPSRLRRFLDASAMPLARTALSA